MLFVGINEDIKPSDIHAFQKIVHMSQKGELVLCTSTVAKEEIEKIPIQYQSTHIEIYETLQILQGSITTRLDDDPCSTGFGQIVEDKDFSKLRSILSDVNDARHLFQAKKAGVNVVITADNKSILMKAKELESQCDIIVNSPSDFLNQLST